VEELEELSFIWGPSFGMVLFFQLKIFFRKAMYKLILLIIVLLTSSGCAELRYAGKHPACIAEHNAGDGYPVNVVFTMHVGEKAPFCNYAYPNYDWPTGGELRYVQDHLRPFVTFSGNPKQNCDLLKLYFQLREMTGRKYLTSDFAETLRPGESFSSNSKILLTLGVIPKSVYPEVDYPGLTSIGHHCGDYGRTLEKYVIYNTDSMGTPTTPSKVIGGQR
jgi:hypothetical protein